MAERQSKYLRRRSEGSPAETRSSKRDADKGLIRNWHRTRGRALWYSYSVLRELLINWRNRLTLTQISGQTNRHSPYGVEYGVNRADIHCSRSKTQVMKMETQSCFV